MKENKLVIKIRTKGYILALIMFIFFFIFFLFTMLSLLLLPYLLPTGYSSFLVPFYYFVPFFLMIFFLLLQRSAFLLLIRNIPSSYSDNEKVDLISVAIARSGIIPPLLPPISYKSMLQHFPESDRKQFKKDIKRKAIMIKNSKITKPKIILCVLLIVFIAFYFSCMGWAGLDLFPWLLILSESQLLSVNIIFSIFIASFMASFAARDILIDFKSLEKIAERISSSSHA